MVYVGYSRARWWWGGWFLVFCPLLCKARQAVFPQARETADSYHNVLSSLPVYMNPDRNDTSKRESTGSLPNMEDQRLPTKERAVQDGM